MRQQDQSGQFRNDLQSIQLSYDLQAGDYVKSYFDNRQQLDEYADKLAEVLLPLITDANDSILELGVGEATTLVPLIKRLPLSFKNTYGFDLSWSRIKFANSFCEQNQLTDDDYPTLFMGDLFETPIANKSIDIVYSSHSLEPNGGREKQAIAELFRITRKWLVLFEPAYELASSEAKTRMEFHGYVSGLPEVIAELGGTLESYELLDFDQAPLNPTGVFVVKPPEAFTNTDERNILACPITKKPIDIINGHYYSSDSMLLYPIVNNIPCLLRQYAIVATKYL